MSIDDAIENADIESEIETKLDRAMRDLDLTDGAEDAINEAMSEYDMAAAIEEELDTNQKLQSLRKSVEKTASALSCFEDVSNAGLFRRLRWLLTGK